MEEIVIQANRRDLIGKRTKALRRSGQLPAVLYGRHIETQPIMMDLKEASRILGSISASTLILLKVAEEEHYVLAREKQRDVLKGTLLHVDFQDVLLTEKVRARVVVHLTGDAPAVSELGGILVQSLENLEFEALPRDLPKRIEVDISGLIEIGDSLTVGDLNLPETVEVLHDPEEAIAVVTMPEAEVEVEEVEEELEEEAEPEVIERGKREAGEAEEEEVS